ncbi:Bax inhibitor-1 family protein [Zea mays]|uniref:Bax inhibitor-1 family protein n=1 Tax=Zea mays TaxID=4577 RepID=A0A1D6HTI7_MAIZE|nr:Bax inhibitor-1 family protein [Zea mays]
MFGYQKGLDVEAGTSGAAATGGARQLYPGMQESPELRWALIRKIYVILSLQLLLTAVVAAVVVKVRAIPHFFTTTSAGLGLYIFLIILPFIVLCPLYFYHEKHPVNLILLGLFTVAISFAVGMTCAFTSGKVILESAILTTVVVLSLTAYTFWAVNRGKDFSFLGPFLFAAIIVLLVFALIQARDLSLKHHCVLYILFPLGKLSQMIYGGLASLIFSGYIVYDTNNIIKRYTYDQYVWAAVSLYLDVINLFLSLMTLFRAAD